MILNNTKVLISNEIFFIENIVKVLKIDCIFFNVISY